jgi:hypothetical protein
LILCCFPIHFIARELYADEGSQASLWIFQSKMSFVETFESGRSSSNWLVNQGARSISGIDHGFVMDLLIFRKMRIAKGWCMKFHNCNKFLTLPLKFTRTSNFPWQSISFVWFI